jgi:WhiB family transcriptional regulator, redox-sensing transcriptional regulator
MTAIDNRAEWWSRAACLTADPELFFPISPGGAAHTQITSAKAVCARCEIRPACLQYALGAGSVAGIWGGTTEEERRLLRQRERKAHARLAGQGQRVSPVLAERVLSR